MNRNPQYDYIAKLHGREAAEQWLQKKKLEEARNQNIINQYGPPQLTPDQMVRVAQKSMGDIPGGLLSEEGPGQMPSPSPLEGAYVNKIPSQQDMWKSQVHSMSPDYLAQDSESVELPSHHAMHGGGYSIPGPEVTPLQQRRMNAQMVPGFYEAFGGGHPDEISPTEAEQLYGYGQFFPRTRDPVSGGLLAEVPDNEETGWYRDDRLNPDKRRKRNPEWWRLINQGMNIYGG
tara:strand:+ start:4008 stop:4703 length:696 start_codon:yes stop_codon:yes gene_type:complete